MVLLAEDVRAKRWSLHDIVREISDVVQARSEQGKDFGAIVVRDRRQDIVIKVMTPSGPVTAWASSPPSMCMPPCMVGCTCL